MLSELRIQNFKGWKDTGTIKMAPITLFFGANSSGKSSIGHFLMLLKQTVDVSDRFFGGAEILGNVDSCTTHPYLARNPAVRWVVFHIIK